MPKVTLVAHTPNPERVVAAAAKLCYSSAGVDELFRGLTPEKTLGFLKMLSSLGHESPLEHAVFTFAIEGVSRTLLAQITRHRIASFSVQSQRYVAENDFDYILPPAVEENEKAKEAFLASMEDARSAYGKISDLLCESYVGAGVDKHKAAKQAGEDARFVLPGACATKMIMTMNARSLRGFFSQRLCERAQWEIREVGDEILRLCKEVSPILFEGAGPPCLGGSCPEGKLSCGKMAEVRQKYS